MTKERDFCEKRPYSSRARRDEVPDDPTMPHRGSHPDDVPVFAGLVQWLLWLDDLGVGVRTQEDVRLLARIRALHEEQDGAVGSP